MPESVEIERRHSEVLVAVVRRYVATGAPVGSKSVIEDLSEPVSSATVRHIMFELEVAGFLQQPHASAGRVPTDKAYRFFVNQRVQASPIGKEIAHYIHHVLGEGAVDPEQLIARASQLLSELSESVGIVLAPAAGEKLLEHIKFIGLPDRRVLVVIVSRPDIIENKVITLDEEIPQRELDRAAEHLNAEFRGWSLRTIRMEIFKRIEHIRDTCETLLTRLGRLFAQAAIGQQDYGTLFVDGAAKMLGQPEFAAAGRVRELLATFDQKTRLVQILTACLERSNHTGVTLWIGQENPAIEMKNLTLIVAPYSYRRRKVGALGVVGPTRMEYDRAIQTVEYIAQLTSRLLSIN